MIDHGYYIEYDDAVDLWAVLDFEDRLVSYFPTKEKAIDFIENGYR